MLNSQELATNLPEEAVKLGGLLDYRGGSMNTTPPFSSGKGKKVLSTEVNSEGRSLKPDCGAS